MVVCSAAVLIAKKVKTQMRCVENNLITCGVEVIWRGLGGRVCCARPAISDPLNEGKQLGLAPVSPVQVT